MILRWLIHGWWWWSHLINGAGDDHDSKVSPPKPEMSLLVSWDGTNLRHQPTEKRDPVIIEDRATSEMVWHYEGSKPCQFYQNHGGFPWPKLNTWPREIQNQAAVSAMEDRPSVRLSFSSCLSVQNSKDPQRHQIPDGFRCFEARKHQVGMALDFSGLKIMILWSNGGVLKYLKWG